MMTYSLGMVPGPTSVPLKYREAYLVDYGSSDFEPEFVELYVEVERALQRLLQTGNQMAVMSGEGMVALWGALKSCVQRGDRVLAVSNGIFGSGFGDMAKSCGAEVAVLEDMDGGFPSKEEVLAKALEFRPHLITVVHCETPSGLLNPVSYVGEVAAEVGALFCVDFVASAGGAEVKVDDWHIDLGLLGSQKALSLLPDLAVVSVSDRAWERIKQVGYEGYDALLPWKNWISEGYPPYTLNWQAMEALRLSLGDILSEGLENVFDRHASAAKACREGLRELGIELYPKREELNSPTVTAAWVPSGWTWERLDLAMREKGVVVGKTYGDLYGKVFRIGHMGSQATLEKVGRTLQALREVLGL